MNSKYDYYSRIKSSVLKVFFKRKVNKKNLKMKIMSSAATLVGFVSCIMTCYCQVKLPEYMKTCDRDMDDLNNCLEEAIKISLPRLTDGIPEFDLPSLDPYREDEMKVEYKKNQIAAKIVVKNVLTFGLAGAKVHDVRAKVEDDALDLEVDVTSPRVFVQGDYKAEGRYNTLHVNTRGKFNCTMKKLKYTWKLHGETEERDGETYLRITRFYMRPDVGDMLIYASNVFPDNVELSDLAIGIANQNWRVIYHEMLPYVQANWDKVGTKIANQLFLKVPYSQLFPISA